jgi:hypothetical protein
VTQLIKDKAFELGFVEFGFTAYDHRYTYQSKKDWVKYPNVLCLAYEQDFEPTQTIPSVDAEIVHSSTYRTEGAAGLELGNFIRSLGYRAHRPRGGPTWQEAGPECGDYRHPRGAGDRTRHPHESARG